jgi:hypothetical protein
MVGTRVRVISSNVQGAVLGHVASVDDGSLVLTLDNNLPVRIPRESITGLDVSSGRKRHVLEGTLIGAAAFGLLGFAFPVDSHNCGANTDNFCSRGEAVAGATIVGAAYGALIGVFVKSDRWHPVVLGGPKVNTSLDIEPKRSVGVRMAVRF